jgi:HEAT repeat protein
VTSPVEAAANQPPPAAPPFPPAPVEELLRLFGKAIRAHQLYLPNNPVHKGAIDSLRAGFAPIWTQAEEIVLSVTETELSWHGVPVLSDPAKAADSLPWTLYKDGIRELELQRGFDAQELTRFLDIIQRVRKASPDEDDLLTLLWEADFTLLRYRYVDLMNESAAPLEDGQEIETPADAHVDREELQAAQQSPAGVVSMADFDATLYFLEEREIEYLKTEVQREYAADLRSNVLAIILDIFELQADRAVRDEAVEILEGFMLHLLSAGRFRTVAYLLHECGVAVQRAAGLEDDHRARVQGLSERLSASEALSQLLQAIDEAPELPPQEELTELFDQLRPTALGPALSWLSRVENQRLRTLLEVAVVRLAQANTGELVRLIASDDPNVVSEAIRRSGALRTPAAVGALGKVLTEGPADQRLLVVSALGDIGSPGALQELERALGDSDRDVRVATARALVGRGTRAALQRVEQAVRGKELRDADLTEKMAYFELYGTLCGDAGVEFLSGILNGKGLFGRREDPEVRACAAMALGRVGSAAAMQALSRASAEKDVVVRNAVARASRGRGQ